MHKPILLTAILLPLTLLAQTDDESQIMKTINQVFEAMRTSDSTLLKEAFIENPTTYTIFKNKEGVTQFRTGDFQCLERTCLE